MLRKKYTLLRASGRCTLVVEWGRRSAEKLKVVGSNPTRSIEPEKNTAPGVVTMTEDIKNVYIYTVQSITNDYHYLVLQYALTQITRPYQYVSSYI